MSLHCYPYYDPPEPSTWCDDCGNYERCQCDRDYAEYLAAWTEAIESGEYETVEMGRASQIEMLEAA